MKTLLKEYKMTLADGSMLIMNPYSIHPCDLEDCHDGTHNHTPQYILIGLSLEETDQQVLSQDLNFIRKTREKLLMESDWTQLPNSPLTVEKQEEWATYRQALRDITNTYQIGQDLVWPPKPL